MSFNAEDYDYNNNFDATTNFRYTAPFAGILHIDTAVGNNSSTAFANRQILDVYKNGAFNTRFTDTFGSNPSFLGVNGSGDFVTAAGDYWEIYITTTIAWQYDGGYVFANFEMKL